MGNKGNRKTLSTMIFENPTTNLALESLQQIDEQRGFIHLVFHGKYSIISLHKPSKNQEQAMSVGLPAN